VIFKVYEPLSMEQDGGMLPLSVVEIRRHLKPDPWTYEMLDQRQREVAERVRGGGAGVLLLSEVAPVITVGRRTPESDIHTTPALLRQLGMNLHRTDRGGLATWHGPGQWVLFAVDSLERLTGDPRGVKESVCRLLRVARELARKIGKTEARDGLRIGGGVELGVWLGDTKFASVGIHVEQGVLLHGLSINIYQTASSFRGLRPCGLDKPVAYLLPESEGRERFDEVGEVLVGLARQEFRSSDL